MIIFVWDLADAITDAIVMSDHFFRLLSFIFLLRGAEFRSKPGGRLGGAGWIHTRKESGKYWATINSGGGRTGR